MTCNNCNFSASPLPMFDTNCFHTKIPLSVVKCPNCKLVYLHPRPSKELGLKYFEDAYSNTDRFKKHSYYRNDKLIFKRNRQRFENEINNIPSPNNKILDFGAGQGHFLRIAMDNNWEARGVEVSEAGRKNAKSKFDITLLKSLKELDISDFGIITLWDVIEHLENPKETIKELTNYLHPKGVFVIETSNINSLDYIIQKRNWEYFNIDHLFYYSRTTMNYLLDTLNFEPVVLKNNSSNLNTKKKNKFEKYKVLLNPMNLPSIIKKKYLSYKHKDVEKRSLMIVIYRKKTE